MEPAAAVTRSVAVAAVAAGRAPANYRSHLRLRLALRHPLGHLTPCRRNTNSFAMVTMLVLAKGRRVAFALQTKQAGTYATGALTTILESTAAYLRLRPAARSITIRQRSAEEHRAAEKETASEGTKSPRLRLAQCRPLLLQIGQWVLRLRIHLAIVRECSRPRLQQQPRIHRTQSCTYLIYLFRSR